MKRRFVHSLYSASHFPPFPIIPSLPFGRLDTLISENTTKRGRKWKPKYEFCKNLWENHEHDKKKIQETRESRLSTTEGDHDPGVSML